MLTEIVCITDILQSPNSDVVTSNVARRLTKLKERLKEFVQGELHVHSSSIVTNPFDFDIPCICLHLRIVQE